MKATRLHAFGGVEHFRYEDAAQPEAGAGQVVIKIEASSLNPVDLYLRQGFLQQMMPMPLPAILGLDAAGTIAAVGSGVAGFSVGDRAIAKLAVDGRGAHAEYAVATVAQLAKLPANVGFAAGATLPLVGLTGRQAVDALAVKPGDRVLVTGALGAVGRVAVQYLKSLGAVPVAGVRPERIVEGKALTGEAVAIGVDGPGGFDAAVDAAGGPAAAAAITLVKDGGTLAAVAGVPDGANADGRIKIASILGRDDSSTLQAVADAAGAGDLSIPVARTFRLDQLAEAHTALAAGHVGGKIIVLPS